MIQEITGALVQSWHNFSTAFVLFVPRVIAATIIFAGGFVIALLVRWVVRRVLTSLHFDRLAIRIGASEMLRVAEMGVGRLRPVLTRHTTPERVNLQRMRANAIEAAEQCGILRIPELRAPDKLERVVAGWDGARRLIFCDEGSEHADPLMVLGRLRPGPLALLVGPEGGFDEAERQQSRAGALEQRVHRRITCRR